MNFESTTPWPRECSDVPKVLCLYFHAGGRCCEVGGILDYAAEAKDGELPEIVKPTEEVSEEDGIGVVFHPVIMTSG